MLDGPNFPCEAIQEDVVLAALKALLAISIIPCDKKKRLGRPSARGTFRKNAKFEKAKRKKCEKARLHRTILKKKIH